ncbi:MAG: SBBP repeat-containing protein [Acidobacteria bacterium]|nr:SBBP repeat-containing protein [Acidobacteriota bacterium]
MRLVGATPSAIEAEERQPGVVNHLVGDARQWRTGIAQYGRVRYHDAYPGIDVVFYGHAQRQLEYDVEVAPGADPGLVRLAFDGADAVTISDRGELLLHTPAGVVRQQAPVTYQDIDDERVFVDARYVPRPDGEIGFEVGDYDDSRPLVIDPILLYATFLGGSDGEFVAADNRLAARIAVDPLGFVYVVGDTLSADFPGVTGSSLQPSKAGATDTTDLFIAKLNPSASQFVFVTYFGGTGNEFRSSLALDASGDIFIAGQTSSADLPAGVGAVPYPTYRGGSYDGFVAKIHANGQSLLWRMYIGGGGIDSVEDIAVDAAGDAYVVGTTSSTFGTGFPVTSAFQSDSGGGSDAFVMKIRGDGSTLVYSTFLGGAANDFGNSIAVDAAGAAYVAGQTFSTNFPLRPVGGPFIQDTLRGSVDVFVAKLAASGSQVIYSTYFGGDEGPTGDPSLLGEGAELAIDSTGAVYLGGWTNALLNFPEATGGPTPFQPTKFGDIDGFVAKLDPAGSSLVYRTFLGGGGRDLVTGIAVNTSGEAYVTGAFQELVGDAPPFPTTPDAHDFTRGGDQDAFVTRLNATGSALLYSTYVGGSLLDIGLSIDVDAAGNVFALGQTNSADFPLVPAGGPGIDSTYGGLAEAFVVRFGELDAPVVASVSPATGPTTGGTPVVISGQRFASGATVRFGASLAPTVVVQSATQILAFAPPGVAGSVAVTVTNPDAKFGTLPAAFTYYVPTTPAPVLSAANLPTGRTSGGEVVQLTGSNFQPGATVLFGLRFATVDALSPTTILVTTPPGAAGAVDVRVVNPDGQVGTLAGGFTYFSELADSDNDGLPDWYENLHPCLSPLVPDAANDPDADGATNLQEYFDGTNPCEAETLFFAEGAAGDFETRFAVFNPDALRTATARFNFQLLVGEGEPTETASTTRTVAPQSRLTLSSDEVAALTNRGFSTEVRSNLPLVADRQMVWDRLGFHGSHAETSIPSPATTWYLAEGATGDFLLFYLIQNPNDTEVDVTVRYLPGDGTPAATKVYRAPAFSRINILVNFELFDTNSDGVPDTPLYASAPLSAEFTATRPIIVERAMYLNNAPGRFFNAGHNSAGVTTPSTQWFLAEGATGFLFDMFVLIANPTATPADVRLTFLLPGGTTYTKTYDGATPGESGTNPSIAANSRFTVYVNDVQPDGAIGTWPLAQTAVSTVVESLNHVPIIVERAMWWARGGGAAGWYEGHNSVGVTETGARWALAEGELGGPRQAITYVLVANTSPFAGRIRARFYAEDGTTSACTFLIAANSRLNVNDEPTCFADMGGRRFATVVESESTGAGRPEIVVERAIYWNVGAELFGAGSNSVGTRLP